MFCSVLIKYCARWYARVLGSHQIVYATEIIALLLNFSRFNCSSLEELLVKMWLCQPFSLSQHFEVVKLGPLVAFEAEKLEVW